MRKVAIAAALVLLVLVGGATVAGLAVRDRLYDPYRGFESPEQFVVIEPGTGTGAIRRSLVDAGVVRDELAFRAALWWTGRALDLQAGEYRFDRPLAAVDVVERIARGDVFTRPITFPEGLTIEEMADIFESRGFGAAADFEAAAANPSLVRAVDAEAVDLEGYLFPETYSLPRNTPASRLVAVMVDRFLATFVDQWHRAAEEQGLTVRQVVTLASLVEEETGAPDERPIVAAVYRNRFRIGMRLQADPTVVYAMRQAGTYAGNIRRADLTMDSPYNTYRYAGLPPGPIAAPGAAALAAVLSPADVNYLYFVSRNDGTHAFARTLAEHNRNVREFQVLYFRR
jgi:UPF0755 protein